jgi:predicted DNA-binding transcriptional regulator YafY
MAKKQRPDAERRVRQCERLGRLLRLLHLIMGKGRWDAGTLADELDCSRRTVYRLLQTLSLAGVPWYFDETTRCYRVRPGYRFPGLEDMTTSGDASPEPAALAAAARQLRLDGERFLASLRDFCDTLEGRDR